MRSSNARDTLDQGISRIAVRSAPSTRAPRTTGSAVVHETPWMHMSESVRVMPTGTSNRMACGLSQKRGQSLQ
eukprot:5939644-Amphidinium_carterae.1